MKGSAVLVLSADALAAVLLGALVEMEAHVPMFRRAGETPRDALRRTRPGIVLVDSRDIEACSTTFIGPAKMMGVPVVVFGARQRAAYVADCGRVHAVDTILLPPAPGELRRLLDAAGR